MAATIQQIVKPTRARGLDTSGNNNHAQIYSGRALEFDGVTDYLTADSAASLADSDFTAAIWIKPTLDGYTGGPGGRVLFSFHDGSNNNRLIVFIAGASTGSGGSTGVANSLKTFTASNLNTANTAGALSGSWERIVLVKQGNSIQTYRNGVADGTITMADTISGSAKFSIGQEWDASTASDFYLGMMSDFQIWNSVWTAADAEYDYLNPEQLALNRGGTSLTNSNLKLWYPMNEGHRGNQSYVLDASNTGLGENIVDKSVSTGDSITGLLDFGDTGLSLEDGAIKVLYNTHASGMYFYLRDSNILTEDLVVGRTYKLTVRAKVSDSEVTFKIQNGISVTAEPLTSTEYVETTMFFNPANATDHYFFTNFSDGSRVSGQTTLYIDSITLKPINAKNNATTAFYGEELIANDRNQLFDEAGQWIVYSNSAVAITGGKLQVTTTLADPQETQGAQLPIGNLTAPVIGRTYRITAKLDDVGTANADAEYKFQFGGGDALVTASDESPTGGVIDTTEQEYYADVVATSTTGPLVVKITSATNDAVTVFTIDDVSVKEVGIASGWTDADQQLDIPQTALQSYNQLAYFLGESTQYAEIDSTIGSDYAGDWSISFWLYEEENNHNYSWPVGADSVRNILTKNSGTRKLYFRDASTTYHLIADYAIPLGQWNHIVVTATGNTSVQAYINGQQFTANSDMSDTEFRLRRFMQGYASSHQAKGSITEIAYYTSVLTEANVLDLYNDGLCKSALEASGSSGLTNYWRNNGLSEWENLKGTLDANCHANVTETMLITAGADSSKDSQGFFMNRQRLTNSLNLDFIEFDNTNIIASEARTFKSNDFDFGTGHISVDAWIKTRQTGEGGFIVTCQSDGYQKEGFGLRISGGDDIWFVVGDGSKFYSATEGTHVNDNEWHHICGVYDSTGGSQSAKYYLDGVLKNTDTTTTDFAGTPNTDAGDLGAINVTSDGTDFHGLSIGGQSWNVVNTTNQDFEGQIDDVRVYKGKALSQTEVLRNFKAGKRSHK